MIGQQYSKSNIANFNAEANNILYTIAYNPAFTISMNDEMMMIWSIFSRNRYDLEMLRRRVVQQLAQICALPHMPGLTTKQITPVDNSYLTE